MNKRVLLGMSGGIDSSVSALLLKQAGYEVIGITMQLVPKETEKQSACCNLSSINDAKRVASALQIPHYTLNIRDDFKRHVIDYFIGDYLLGNTPNPCVECNRHIKFDALNQKATELNASYVATGHYCTITQERGVYQLQKAKDLKKDQSYFLYMLNQDQLKQTLFPLGSYEKPAIRKIALDHGLINATKKESQDICFITSGNYADFIKENTSDTSQKPGNIVTKDGTVLGTHTGIYHYTIGQRKGLNISAEKPLYVTKINASKNEIVVGFQDDCATSTFTIKNCTFNHPGPIAPHSVFSIKLRYQMVPFSGTIRQVAADLWEVAAASPQKFVCSGQSCVLYDIDTVIGGGVIC